MFFYMFLLASLLIANATVVVYGIIDRWFWPWIAILVFLLVFLFLVLLFLVYCVLLSFFVDVNKPIHRQNRYFYHILVQVAYILLGMLRVKIHFIGKEYAPKDSHFLMVCNHTAWLDPAIPLVLFKKHHIAFISKKETHSYPIAGKFLHETACLAIDRENNREALKTINKAAEFIKEGVCAIGIYPEGWVNQSGELLEFRHGAFRIAKKADCPVIVTHITNADKILKRPLWKKCDVYFEIKGVIPVEYVREHKTVEISDYAREIMTK